MPTAINHIYDTTGKKVIYFGYSQGTTQLFYGLSKLWHTDLPSKFERVLAWAPCFVVDQNCPLLPLDDTWRFLHAKENAIEMGYGDYMFGPKSMDPTFTTKIVEAMAHIFQV